MRVIRLPRRRLLPILLAILAAILAVVSLLRPAQPTRICVGDNESRITYLESLGWQVEPQPLETLQIRLPEDLSAAYSDYLKLQKSQSMPFSDYAGQIICRTTYRITNYPGGRTDAQVNLLQYRDRIIAGDVMLLGKDGGQFPLPYSKD